MSPEAILIKGLKELSLAYSREQVKAFMTYLSELKKWNRAYNLTSLKTDEEIIVKHFLDSLLYLKAMPEGEVRVMDAGSGAGFPGVPLKIIRPEITMYLLEPSRKKANFLVHIIKTLGLQKIEVVEKRIEEVKSLTADIAVTRALFDIKEFIKKASPHLEKGGRLILSKGPKVSEELKGLEEIDYELLTLKLPLSDIRRFIVVVRRDTSAGTVQLLHAPAAAKPRSNPRDRNVQRTAICANIECRLRKAGCTGFEGCPGFKGKT